MIASDPALGYGAAQNQCTAGESRPNVHHQSVRRTFGFRVADGDADLCRHHDRPGRGRDAVRDRAQGQRQVLLPKHAQVEGKGAKPVGGGEIVSIAVQTAVVDVLASGEFCNPRRRLAHLLGMYGFVLYVVSTVVMVSCYSTPRAGARNLGAAVVARRPDDLRRRLLVLVLHPRRRRGGRPFAVPHRCARTCSSCRCCQRDARAALGLGAGEGQPVAPVMFWRFTSSRRRCCSARCRGPSSRTCSSSPRRPSRRE